MPKNSQLQIQHIKKLLKNLEFSKIFIIFNLKLPVAVNFKSGNRIVGKPVFTCGQKQILGKYLIKDFLAKSE